MLSIPTLLSVPDSYTALLTVPNSLHDAAHYSSSVQAYTTALLEILADADDNFLLLDCDLDKLVMSVLPDLCTLNVFRPQNLAFRWCRTFLVKTNDRQMKSPCSVFITTKLYVSTCMGISKKHIIILLWAAPISVLELEFR